MLYGQVSRGVCMRMLDMDMHVDMHVDMAWACVADALWPRIAFHGLMLRR